MALEFYTYVASSQIFLAMALHLSQLIMVSRN